MVVAPHPDDEVLGVGGVLAEVAGADVVAVTDGEASHPDSTVYSQEALAAVRRDETATALTALGQDPSWVFRLGHPDGRVDEPALVAALLPHLSRAAGVSRPGGATGITTTRR